MSPTRASRSADVSRLVLASASPRRAELLRIYGYAAEVIHPPIDEPQQVSPGVSPAAQAEAFSHFKARSVAAIVRDGVIIGGDTVVALGDRCFGKPADRADARTILEALTGTTHYVITGVTLIDAASGARMIRHASTAVTMRPMTTDQLEQYLDTNAWKGKAGAYGIQDYGDAFVERVEGSFTNVVGLPMEMLVVMLGEWGIAPGPPPPQAGDARAKPAGYG